MASNPPGKCCTEGFKHEGTPTGEIIQVAGVDAYIAAPKGKVHKDVAILYIPDIIGLYENSELVADQFADEGYYTLLLDVTKGDPIALNQLGPNLDLPTWIKEGGDGKHPHTPEALDPLVADAIDYLRGNLGIKKIGIVGYCFGAKYVVRFLAEGKGVDAGYVAHPSFVTEEELAAIKGPLAISAAETDGIFPVDLRYKSEEILKATGQPYQINLYSGVAHGFAVKCDLSQKVQKYAKEQAFLQAKSWFDFHLLD